MDEYRKSRQQISILIFFYWKGSWFNLLKVCIIITLILGKPKDNVYPYETLIVWVSVCVWYRKIAEKPNIT